MKISSPEFQNGEDIPKKYTCDGADVNPPLVFEDVPDGVGSLVLVVDDPDATAKVWVHWILYNISPETVEIEEDSVPEGAGLGHTDFGESEYGGPCPTEGEHTYRFKLYALDTEELYLPEGDSVERVEDAMQNHIVETAELVGTYTRE